MNDPTLDLRIKINRARVNLMFMIILSIANIFFICNGSQTRLPYASAISRLSVELAFQASSETGGYALQILGLIAGCLILLAFTICYFLSKTKSKFFVIALSLLIADTFALIVFSLGTGSIAEVYVILDIFIHFLSILYTVKGIKASEEMNYIRNNPQENDESHNNEPDPEISEDDQNVEFEEQIEVNEDLSQPIGKYVDNGTAHLVSGIYKGLEVFAIIEDSSAKLIINGYVCDEFEISFYDEFQLRAIVNDVDFSFEYKKSSSGTVMYLYADDNLLDSIGIS